MDKTMAENIAKVITDTFKDMAKTETVIGKEFQVGECTIIPVIKFHMGFGTGGSGDSASSEAKSRPNGGGGGGLSVEPIAFLVVSGKEVHLLNMGRRSSLETMLDAMPALVEKTADAFKGMGKDSDQKDGK